MAKANLDDIVPHNLTCAPDQRRAEINDTQCPGLYIALSVGRPNFGRFVFSYKIGTRRVHYVIGDTDTLTVAMAREIALDLKRHVRAGRDPKAEQQAKVKPVPTFSEFFTKQYLPHAKQHKKSWDQDQRLFDLRCNAEFGKLPLNRITRQHLQLFLVQLSGDGLAAATCNHFLKLMRHSLNLAVEWEIIDRNPASKMKLLREDNEQNYYLKGDDLKRLIKVLNEWPNRPVALFAMFLLASGGRKTETLNAKWEHVDIDGRVWRIPAENAKSGKTRSVPLNDAALDVLEKLGTRGNHEYLFVSSNTGEHLQHVQNTWGRIRAKAGLSNLRLHDLRHSYASFLVNAGENLYSVQRILGHASPKITQRYAHLGTAEMLSASDAASRQIAAATANEPEEADA